MTKPIAALALCLAGCAPTVTTVATVDLPAAIPVEGRANPSVWPQSASPAAITDAATEASITAVIARMTLAQKVGQLIQADISAITPSRSGPLSAGIDPRGRQFGTLWR